MTPLKILNISYGQKKGQESYCQFDSRPLKVKNRPDILAFRWRVTYHWKNFSKSYNFALDHTSIKGLDKKFMGLQNCKSPDLGSFKIPNLGILKQNDIWV
jgi:hypothetical protein